MTSAWKERCGCLASDFVSLGKDVFGCFLYYRASVAVFVQLVEERLKIPGVESAIERSFELQL